MGRPPKPEGTRRADMRLVGWRMPTEDAEQFNAELAAQRVSRQQWGEALITQWRAGRIKIDRDGTVTFPDKPEPLPGYDSTGQPLD